jgi:hypothetical protein
MKEQRFIIEIENQTFKFEVDKNGYVWRIENDQRDLPNIKTNIGQTNSVDSLDDAIIVAKIMLYASGRIKRLEL